MWRRIEPVAGELNAVLVAMALGLGILDLAGTIGRLAVLRADARQTSAFGRVLEPCKKGMHS